MTEQPPKDILYEAQVETRIRKVLRGGPRILQTLIAHSEGAYPTDVTAILRRLQEGGTVRETREHVWSLAGSGDELVETEQELETHPDCGTLDFPEPHPLDFDWRFTCKTLRFLGQRIEELRSVSVAILGAPTLFKYLTDRGTKAHLFDRNPHVVQFLKQSGYEKITQCDLFRYSPGLQFGCVVADPPWYLDYYGAFLRVSRELLIPDGKLLLSVLPRLTRPSAGEDRKGIQVVACQYGFDLVKGESGVLQYASPPFETEALKAEGLNFPTWRLGDLFTYLRTDREVGTMAGLKADDDQLWRTFDLGKMIVKVKWDGSHGTGSFSFGKVAGARDMRFRTVSRRSPLRSRIDLWTSRNLVLEVGRPDLACEALDLLCGGEEVGQVAMQLVKAKKLSGEEAKRLTELLDILVDESKE